MTLHRPARWLLVFVLLMTPPLGAQRTPEQRYFDWTALPFPAAEYAARRTALSTALRASGGGIFLTPAAAGVSEGFRFRQLDTFWYLTGLEVPDAIVAVDSDDGRTILLRLRQRYRPDLSGVGPLHRRAARDPDGGISVFTEDVILITPDGRDNLTGHVARTPARLEALMRSSGR